MENLFTKALVASVLMCCASSAASANQLLAFVTVQQILDNFGNSFGANCNSGLTNCAVYGVGFRDTNTGPVATSGAGYQSPVPGGGAAWVPALVADNRNGFEAGGTANGNTGVSLITNNTHTGDAGQFYVANLGGNSLAGLGALSATTQIGFLLDFATDIAAGTTTTLRLRLLATQLDINSGAEIGLKSVTGLATISGVTLMPTPEPASLFLALSGFGLIGLAVRRRR
jgi:hypothetical protein